MSAAGWAAGGQIAGTAAQMAFNASQGKKNRKFQESMYGRRYQMTMRDMRKAGLNPILAAGSGLGGGGSPSGSMAQASNPNLGDTITKATNKAAERAVLSQSVATAKSQEEFNTASAATQRQMALKIVEETKNMGWKQPGARVGRMADEAILKAADFVTGEGPSSAKGLYEDMQEEYRKWREAPGKKRKSDFEKWQKEWNDKHHPNFKPDGYNFKKPRRGNNE